MLSFIIGIVLRFIFINSIYAFFKQAEVVCPLKIIFFYYSLLPVQDVLTEGAVQRCS